MNKPRRCHILMIVDSTYRTLLGLVFFIAASFFDSFFGGSDADIGDAGEMFSNYSLFIFLGLTALLLLILFFSFLRWKNLKYYVDDSNFVVQKGVITKNTTTLPFERINTVDISQNLFHQLFGICRLKMDSGTVEAKAGSEVDLILREPAAQELRAYILSCKASLAPSDGGPMDESAPAPGPGAGFSANAGDFIRLGLTSRKLAAFLALAAGFFAWGAEFLPVSRFLPKDFSPGDFSPAAVPVLIGIFAVIVVVSNLYSILRSLVLYYAFRIYRSGDNICVAHGLLSKKNYTLPVAKIHCVMFRQNLLQQLFHLKEISVITMGYGDEKNEAAMLFPIAGDREALAVLSALLPEMALPPLTETPGKAGFVVRAMFGSLFWIVLSAALALISPWFLLGCLLILPLALVNYREYKNTAFGIGGGVLAASQGAFTKSALYVRTSSVQSVSGSRGILARRFGYFTARVHYYGSKTKNNISLPGMKDRSFETLRGFDGPPQGRGAEYVRS